MKKRFLSVLIIGAVSISACFSQGVGAVTSNSKAVSTKSTSAIVYPKAPPKEHLLDTSVINDESKWGTLNTHDPSVYKDGNWYYTFSTDVKVGGAPTPGIQIRKSKDLINWQWVGRAFNMIPLKAWTWTKADTMWAPDVTKIGNTYYLYYAVSQFGTNQSFIGVATSKSIEGPWQDQGEVIKTKQGDVANAIDPNIVRDSKGNLWMAYGSFFGGIYISQVNPKTGKLLKSGTGKLIAKRNSEGGNAVEAPYIIYNPDAKKYYLFVSYDSLFSDYNVRVGRSDKIDGPYKDYNGKDMTNTEDFTMEIGNKVLGGYKFGDSQGWLAPGHNSVLRDGNNYYIVHHARPDTDKNWPYLNVRKILWSPDGWPMVSPERYAGEKEQKVDKSLILGKWDSIVLDKYDNSQLSSKSITLLANGKISGGNIKDHWQFTGTNILKLYLYADNNAPKGGYWIYTAKVMPSWDWEKWCKTIVFTGINQKGVSIWGKKENVK